MDPGPGLHPCDRRGVSVPWQSARHHHSGARFPSALIRTFAVLLLMGYSANTVSLLAMVLAIGIVVDDAIVVVENVERVLEEEADLSPAAATLKAMNQITGPIIAITLVLLSVFVPVAFIPSISGQLFRQFAVTISVAMLISALNALTLSPALCAVFLRHEPKKRRRRMRWCCGRSSIAFVTVTAPWWHVCCE